jgi:hypothetical protein
MFNSKTYFDQVPLEFVKVIVEEQIRTETAGEAIKRIDKDASSETPPEAEGRSILQPRRVARVRSAN